MSILIKASLVVTLLCSSVSYAEVIRNERGGYSFTFPPGWSMDRAKKGFTVVGPNKVELSEMPAGQPPADTSLEVATDTAVSAWLALGGSSTHQAFDLSGKKWKGRAVILSMHSQQLVLFVAKSKNKYFRHFTLSIPVEEWKNNSQQYLGILRTLEFSDSK